MVQIPSLALDDEDLGTDDIKALIRAIEGDGIGRQRVRFEVRGGRPFLLGGKMRMVKLDPAPTPKRRNGITPAESSEPTPEDGGPDTDSQDDESQEAPEQEAPAEAKVTRPRARRGMLTGSKSTTSKAK